jgi:hypothetical protein
MRAIHLLFKMPCKCLVAFAIFVLITNSAFAQQSSETVYQNWKMLGESPTNMEISGRVVQCDPDSAVQLHLDILNEGPSAQVAHFNITITNPSSGAQVIKEISYSIALGEFAIPHCGTNDFAALRIGIPAGWDPATVQFTLTFIP